MDYNKKTLEERLENISQSEFSFRKDYGGKKDGYKSKGERVIAETLVENQLRFSYEPRIFVEEKRENDTEKGRLWYPDFILEDFGIVIEYIGRPKDEEYMEGIKRKKETYERMGMKVVYITNEDLFDKDNNYKLRKDYKERILEAIERAMNKGDAKKPYKGKIDVEAVDHDYKSPVYRDAA